MIFTQVVAPVLLNRPSRLQYESLEIFYRMLFDGLSTEDICRCLRRQFRIVGTCHLLSPQRNGLEWVIGWRMMTSGRMDEHTNQGY